MGSWNCQINWNYLVVVDLVLGEYGKEMLFVGLQKAYPEAYLITYPGRTDSGRKLGFSNNYYFQMGWFRQLFKKPSLYIGVVGLSLMSCSSLLFIW